MRTILEFLKGNLIINKSDKEFEEELAASYNTVPNEKPLNNFWQDSLNVEKIIEYFSQNKSIPNYNPMWDLCLKNYVTPTLICDSFAGVWKDAAKEMYSISNFGYKVFSCLKNAPCLNSGMLDDFVCQNTISSPGVSHNGILKYLSNRKALNSWQIMEELTKSNNLNNDILQNVINNLIPNSVYLTPDKTNVKPTYYKNYTTASITYMFVFKNVDFSTIQLDQILCKILTKLLCDADITLFSICKNEKQQVLNNLSKLSNNQNLSKLQQNKIKKFYNL